ncbi:pyrroline-5-carboxylate reductase [Carnobacterium gallinarum]|uniref:pyrroline-5-carboxylate reductase n=1 Tax=Carnobacterium gallinarum TaxID=2749 RepID=UPI00054F7C1F|nr:pyrroline-5-carboxylate reductase [Carnobacterium gallinarum]
MKVGFIGTGNMASAIIKGMIQTGHTKANDIFVFDVATDKLNAFTQDTGTTACESNQALIAEVDIVLLAVKPNSIGHVLIQLQTEIAVRQPLIISIAAGTTIEKIQGFLGASNPTAIIRVMPNLNAMIGEGMAAVCGNQITTKEQITFVLGIFNAVGLAVELSENQFSTFTAIAGSSPAYAFLFIDSLARGAVKNGMPKDLATKIAAQAVLGSAKMILESDESPWNLIDQVSSPGGTTVAGLVALEDEAFISTVIKGVDATIKKDQDLMQQ